MTGLTPGELWALPAILRLGLIANVQATGTGERDLEAALEVLLGFDKRGDQLRITPRVPASWELYVITYRHGSSLYTITMRNATGAAWGATTVTLDGIDVPGGAITLVDDGAPHSVGVCAVAT